MGNAGRGALAGCLAAVLGVGGCAAQAPTPTPVFEQYTPVVGAVLSEPVPIEATDGAVHIPYELLLTNTLHQTVAIDRLVVSDGDRTLLDLDAAGILERTKPLGAPTPTNTLLADSQVLVLVDVVLDQDAARPSALRHELTISPEHPQPPLFDAPMTQPVAPTPVADDPATLIGPPLRGGGWLVANGCCGSTGHRAAALPINGELWVSERFAVDLIRLDANGRFRTGPAGDLAGYPFEGEEVLAVADGPVVAIVSDAPEATPGILPDDLTIGAYGGNHVIQDLGGGRFALYAHLQPGNPVGLAVGDVLRRGEVIGGLGNSGHSDFPHLHFQLMDAPNAIAADGLPFVIDGMALDGLVRDADLDTCIASGAPCRIDRSTAGGRGGVLLTGDVFSMP